jgi:phosphoribosylformylglycinamidine cyclo-ligase
MRRGAYARAGVDVSRLKDIHSLVAEALGSTFSARKGRFGEPLLGIGHYAGIIDVGSGLALTLHTDGVGTKVLVAQQLRKFDTVGIDCVAMTVNDLVCLGSEPIALLDYLALERADEELVREIMKGLRAGAKRAFVSIVGGETAVLRGVIKGVGGRGFDLAAMGVGVVRKKGIIDGSKIVEGDEVFGLRSSGLHSNGFSLVRRAFRNLNLAKFEPLLGRSVGEELLTPTEIYVAPILELVRRSEVHGLAHITGGAFSKLTRLVDGRKLRFRLLKWDAPPIFEMVRRIGKVAEVEMYSTFNMGVGFCVIAPRTEAERIIATCARQKIEAFRLGRVERGLGVSIGGLKIA